MKTFFESKTNWLGMMTVLMGVLALVQDYMLHNNTWTAPGILGILIGVCTIVLRTFFTDTVIRGADEVKIYKNIPPVTPPPADQTK